MTAFPPAGEGVSEPITSIRLPAGFEASWAGVAPGGGFCFGSEDGSRVVTDVNGRVTERLHRVNLSGEAVNGMAFLDPWTAISTRNEITLIEAVQGSAAIRAATIPVGAHDVIAGRGGTFLAPLGRQGLLSCTPTTGTKTTTYTIHGSTSADRPYFYRVISVRAAEGKEVIACATRQMGVAAAELRDHTLHDYNTMSFNGLDVIGLCPLQPDDPSASAVALGIDGTLILFRDVLHERRPTTVRYAAITGTAYRVLSARGFLFVLTSRALYVIRDLVERALAGDTSDTATPTLTLPLEAVDAYLADNRWLLILLPDGVLRLDIELLAETKSTTLRPFDRRDVIPTRLDPAWTAQSANLIAVAG